MNSKLIEQLKRHEGFRAYIYKCTAGKNTIGYGHNIDSDPNRTVSDFKNGITKEDAEKLLVEDIEIATKSLHFHFPFIITLSEVRQDCLVNMAFNLGIGGLLKFKKMIRALTHRNFEQAGVEMRDSKWYRDVGNRAKELIDQMVFDKYQF